MENFTSAQVGLAFLTALIVGLIIPVSNAITAKLKERAGEKQARLAKQISESVEAKKINLAEDERNSQETWKIVEFWKQKAESCEGRFAQLEIGRSLPSSIVTELYKAIAALGRELATSELMVLRGEAIESVKTQNERVRHAFDALNAILP